MPIAKISIKSFSNDAPNVRVSNQTDAESVILEIYSMIRRYPPIALLPNSARDLLIVPGEYRFDFNYLRIAGDGKMKATVVTAQGTFGPKPGKSKQGRTGTVAIFAKV